MNDKIDNLKRLNRTSYEEVARSFDVTRQGPWQEIVPLTQHVKEGDSILDLGCGNGRLLNALPSVNFSYLGIDGNDYLLHQASKKFPDRKFTLARLEDMELDSKAYDTIFCVAAFHHLVGREDRLSFLMKCLRALKPEGILILSAWKLWQLRYIKNMFIFPMDKVSLNDFFIPWNAGGKTVYRYYHGFTKIELRYLLREVGFKNFTITKSLSGTRRGYNYIVQAVR